MITSCTSYSQIVSPRTNEYFFTIHYTAGKSYGMTNTLAIGLMNKMRRKLRIFFADIILYFITEITYYKNKFLYAGFIKLINNDTQDRFAGQRDQSLRLGVSMRSQFGSCALLRE